MGPAASVRRLAIAVLVAAAALRGAAEQRAGGARTLDASVPITFFVASGPAEAGFRPADRQLAEWAFEAWRKSAPDALRFEPAAEPEAIVRLYWAGPNDGQYGEMQPL